MMPQDRTALPAETEWRAEPYTYWEQDELRWSVEGIAKTGLSHPMVNGLTEAQAKLIAAAPAMAALCEELADALENSNSLLQALTGLDDAIATTAIVENRIALTKAGRAPR